MIDPLEGMPIFRRDKKLTERINLLVSEWALAYPNVNIIEQMKWAHSWLVTHPERPKKLLARFINNWLMSNEQRYQEKKHIQQNVGGKYVETKPDEEEIMTADDFKKMREEISRNRLKARLEKEKATQTGGWNG